jgi:outer membrane protein assembly factor BamB
MQGRIFARDYVTGKLIYSADVGASVESDPTLVGGRIFFHLRDHRILAMDAMSGKIFWSYKRSVPYLTTLQRVSHALSYGNKLIVGFADGYVCALSMEEGILEWEQKITTAVKFVDVDVKPVYFNGMIVIGSASGDIKFIDPINGAVAKSFDFNLSYRPLKIKNSLLFGTTRGHLVLMDANGKVFKKARISKTAISSIKKWKTGLAVTTMGGMFHYLDMDFNVINTFNLGHEQSSVFGYLESNEDTIALYSSRNRLYVFK